MCLGLYTAGWTIYIAVKAAGLTKLSGWTTENIVELLELNSFRAIVISLAATYVLWLAGSLLALDPWHVFTCIVQYLLLQPTFIVVLSIFSLANTHDISCECRERSYEVLVADAPAHQGARRATPAPRQTSAPLQSRTARTARRQRWRSRRPRRRTRRSCGPPRRRSWPSRKPRRRTIAPPASRQPMPLRRSGERNDAGAHICSRLTLLQNEPFVVIRGAVSRTSSSPGGQPSRC